ncbi:MAG TPA: hypothetical protein VFE62_28535 [Gemmataceae bacterium]|nr:hypothetical protein [Gemmataceae bacterium]
MRLALPCAVALLIGAPVHAQKAVHCNAVHGALLIEEKPGKWDAVKPKSDIPAEKLVIALFGAELQAPDGAVDVKLVADVGQRGPFASLEARARFHVPKDTDLDVSLERGIAVIANAKKSGEAKVALRVGQDVFEITLPEPKSRVGIEVHGRHMPGPPTLKSEAPVVTMLIFALEGDAVVSNGKQATRLTAPPGASLYMWDSISHSVDVQRFEKLPDFAKPFSAKEKELFEMVCHCAKPLADKPGAIRDTLDKLISSDEPKERKTAVVCMGALDDMPGMLSALGDPKHADVRDMAVLTLRHWIGRGPGQAERWDAFLLKQGYTAKQAKNMLYLLRGIEEAKLRQPATYDVLIGALNHKKIEARELAHWHLIRLVPGGNKIAYDAAAPEAERLQAIAAFRRLVPEGELPMPPKKN